MTAKTMIHEGYAVSIMGESDQVDAAMAALNAHADLLAACRAALKEMDSMRSEMDYSALELDSQNPEAAEYLRDYAPLESGGVCDRLRAALEKAMTP